MSGEQKKSSRFSTLVNSLGIGTSGLGKFIDALEQSTQQVSARRRDFVRWPFRKESIQLTVRRTGQQAFVEMVACRNLSAQGMSLLHSRPIEPGCVCNVGLPRLRGDCESLAAKVVRCEHRAGTFYEIGVVFDKTVDLKEYVSASPSAPFGALEKIASSRLEGVVVYFSACPRERADVRAKLRHLTLTLRAVADRDALMRQIELGCDAVVLSGSRETVKELVRLVEPRWNLPIGVVTRSVMDVSLIPISVSGIDRVMAHPCTPEELARFVAELLHARTFLLQKKQIETSNGLWSLREQLEVAARGRDAVRCAELCSIIETSARDSGTNELSFLARRTRALIVRAGEGRVEKLGTLVRSLLARLDGESRTHAA